jgi:very-short-patch-repair endonuclease
MCNHPTYTGKTFGVISLLGNEQATLIELQLRTVLPMSVIEERRLLCGNSAQFQGDERDVILLSMVDSNEGDGVMRLQGDGARDMNKKRYNVAVSRARDQLWIVHSVNYQTDLKPTDLRRQLLEYAHEQANAHSNTETQQTESVFEELVLKQLLARGYQVQTQYPVGYYRIDLVVIGENSRLAVECDGDKYHSGSEKIAEDLARQAILERLGWQFYRIRGSVFFREPEQALAGLWQRLADLGIQPKTNESSEIQNNEMLHLEIIRVAEQIETDIEPEIVIDEIASTPAVDELPNHQSINDMFRQRSEARRKGLI